MEIFTIGYTKKKAEEFFGALRHAGIRRLIDVRLHNSSQLAGYTRRDDLGFFLRELCGAAYMHEPRLAPTEDLLDAYRKGTVTWEDYEHSFLTLMEQRQIERVLDRELFVVPTVLLCSEATPECCHRRLVAEYLRSKWGDVEILHL